MCALASIFIVRFHQILTFFFFNFLFYFIFLRVTSSTYNFERHPRTKCTNTRRIMLFYVSFLCFMFRRHSFVHPHRIGDEYFVSRLYIFSLFLFHPPHKCALPFIDWCSFKGSRDAGLNQRRTRYIYTQFNIFCSFLSWFFDEKSFVGCSKKLVASAEAWIGLQLVMVETLIEIILRKLTNFLYLFIDFFIYRFCLLIFVKLELVSIVW